MNINQNNLQTLISILIFPKTICSDTYVIYRKFLFVSNFCKYYKISVNLLFSKSLYRQIFLRRTMRKMTLSGPLVAVVVGIGIVVGMLYGQPYLQTGYNTTIVNLVYVFGFGTGGIGVYSFMTRNKNSIMDFRW